MSDYISREALIGKVEKHYCAPCKGQGGDLDGNWCRSCVINSVLEKVRGIPAADVIEKKHGYWIKRIIENEKEDYPIRNVDYICSRCEACWHEPLKYCPMCLAEMDKEETNDKKQPEEAPGE